MATLPNATLDNFPVTDSVFALSLVYVILGLLTLGSFWLGGCCGGNFKIHVGRDFKLWRPQGEEKMPVEESFRNVLFWVKYLWLLLLIALFLAALGGGEPYLATALNATYLRNQLLLASACFTGIGGLMWIFEALLVCVYGDVAPCRPPPGDTTKTEFNPLLGNQGIAKRR